MSDVWRVAAETITWLQRDTRTSSDGIVISWLLARYLQKQFM